MEKRWFKTFDVAFGVSASLEHLTLQGDEYIFPGGAFYVNGSFGNVRSNDVDSDGAARPAFTIDLSKIEWSKV